MTSYLPAYLPAFSFHLPANKRKMFGKPMKKYLYILPFFFLQCQQSGFAQGKPTSMQDTIKLSDVTVVAERPMVQRKADRMIVSVEHSKLLKSKLVLRLLGSYIFVGQARHLW